MKKLLLILIMVLLAMTGFSQNIDADRGNFRKNLTMPYVDTIAVALKIGEVRARPQDSLVYRWNGRRWIRLADYSPQNLNSVLIQGNVSSLGASIGGLIIPPLAHPTVQYLVINSDGSVGTSSGPGGVGAIADTIDVRNAGHGVNTLFTSVDLTILYGKKNADSSWLKWQTLPDSSNQVYFDTTNTAWTTYLTGYITRIAGNAGGGAGTDPLAYHNIFQLNDSTLRFLRANGSADTVVFHYTIVPGGGGGGGCTDCYFAITQVDGSTFTLNRHDGSKDTVRVITTSGGGGGGSGLAGFSTVGSTGPATYVAGTLNIPTTTFQGSLNNGNALNKADTILQTNNTFNFSGGNFAWIGDANWSPNTQYNTAHIAFQNNTLTDISTPANSSRLQVEVMAIATPTLIAANTNVTYNQAFTLYIGAEPFPNGNLTIGKSYSLGVLGAALFQGLNYSDYISGQNGGPSLATATLGTGAGTGDSYATTGSTLVGDITINTGTTPAGAGATIATLQWTTGSFPNHSYVTLDPGNAAAAALNGANQVWTSTGTGFICPIKAGTTALAASTTYIWHYKTFGN